MSVIILLLLVSISVATLFLAAFIWSVKSGQYDDEASPPMRMLFDDKPPSPSTEGNERTAAETQSTILYQSTNKTN
jgi:cbb3-type cytochrome oxidase maturation protein